MRAVLRYDNSLLGAIQSAEPGSAIHGIAESALHLARTSYRYCCAAGNASMDAVYRTLSNEYLLLSAGLMPRNGGTFEQAFYERTARFAFSHQNGNPEEDWSHAQDIIARRLLDRAFRMRFPDTSSTR